jgi:hypothetical protein
MEKVTFGKITATVKAHTEKSILLAKDDVEKWVPVSCMGIRNQMKHEAREFKRNETYEFTIAEWWLKKEGW